MCITQTAPRSQPHEILDDPLLTPELQRKLGEVIDRRANDP